MGWFFNQQNKKQQSQNQQNNNTNFHSYSKSFYSSSSLKCQNDPEDDQMMVCEQTIYDGNNKQKTIKRMPKTQNIIPFPFPSFGLRNDSGHNIFDHAQQTMEDEVEKIFQNLARNQNVFGRIYDFMNGMQREQFFEKDFNHNRNPYNEKRYQPKKQQQNTNYYFNSDKKDTRIIDL